MAKTNVTPWNSLHVISSGTVKMALLTSKFVQSVCNGPQPKMNAIGPQRSNVAIDPSLRHSKRWDLEAQENHALALVEQRQVAVKPEFEA